MTCEYVKRQSPPTPKHKETKNQILMKAFFFLTYWKAILKIQSQERKNQDSVKEKRLHMYIHTQAHTCMCVHLYTAIPWCPWGIDSRTSIGY